MPSRLRMFDPPSMSARVLAAAGASSFHLGARDGGLLSYDLDGVETGRSWTVAAHHLVVANVPSRLAFIDDRSVDVRDETGAPLWRRALDPFWGKVRAAAFDSSGEALFVFDAGRRAPVRARWSRGHVGVRSR